MPPKPKVNPKTAPKKKGAAPKIQPTYKQPPFDERIKNLPRPILGVHAQPIRRGFMVWDKSLDPPGGSYAKNDPAEVKFLFNPSTISTSYAVTDGSAQAALNYSSTQGLNGGALLLPLQQQTSFTLMFDRTYEMNYGADAHILNYGVDVDVAALRQYTGMYANVYNTKFGNNSAFFQAGSTNTQTTQTGQPGSVTTQSNKFNQPLGNLAQGFMQVTIGYLYFGGANVNNAAVGTDTTVGITYYGYIDSWSVEYTHFSQNMVPMRCVVDISFSFLPPPIAAPDLGAAGAIAATQLGASGAIGVVTGAINAAVAKAGR